VRFIDPSKRDARLRAYNTTKLQNAVERTKKIKRRFFVVVDFCPFIRLATRAPLTTGLTIRRRNIIHVRTRARVLHYARRTPGQVMPGAACKTNRVDGHLPATGHVQRQCTHDVDDAAAVFLIRARARARMPSVDATEPARRDIMLLSLLLLLLLYRALRRKPVNATC